MADTSIITKANGRLEEILKDHNERTDRTITQVEHAPNQIVNNKYTQSKIYDPDASVNQLVEMTIEGTTMIKVPVEGGKQEEVEHTYKTLVKLFEFDCEELGSMTQLKQRDYIVKQCAPMRIGAAMEMEKGYNPVDIEFHFYKAPQLIIDNLDALININNGITVRVYSDGEEITKHLEELDTRVYDKSIANNRAGGSTRRRPRGAHYYDQ
jgi:hypothetical protein